MAWAYQCTWEYTSPSDLLRKERTVTFISERRVSESFAITRTQTEVTRLIAKYEETDKARGKGRGYELSVLRCEEVETQ